MTSEVLAILALALARLGIPILVILGLSYVAYRWLGAEKPAVRHEVPRATVGGPAPLAHLLYAGPHCWDSKGCPQEAKANCPAFARPELPCWLAVQMKTGHLREDCFGCQFYEHPVIRA